MCVLFIENDSDAAKLFPKLKRFLAMFQDGCFGFNPPFQWTGFVRKPTSFHIMDILHLRHDHQVPSALEPLQDFCRTKSVHNIVSQSSERIQAAQKDLKFGINRILSDEVGNKTKRHENRNKLPTMIPTCDCGSPSCGVLMFSQLSSQSYPPQQYTLCHSETEALPGPYSILNDDACSNGQSKRKRSWSRAVFSNLQRKGLEKRFEVQKYVTKPDRRQLAAMLGLTDAQVKVWFQNRRMKWRHMQQIKEKELSEKPCNQIKPADDVEREGNSVESTEKDEQMDSDTDP